jgi:prepilin-type N-terminal cleavage/methylation domain-containing protein
MRPTPTPQRPRPRGFTLVEILIVIGIIVVLAAILVPTIGRAMRQAKRTRTAADIQSLAMAIEAFKADHNDIPRTIPGTPNLGAAILGKYLNGPLGDGYLPTSPGPPAARDDTADPPAWDAAVEYPAGAAVQNGGTRFVSLIPNSGVATNTLTTWQDCGTGDAIHDFQDGPGFRMQAGRKKYGPYVTAEKMKMGGIAFVDGNGNAILYFPGRPGTGGSYATPNSYVARSSAASDNKALMKYDADDNLECFRRPAEAAQTQALARIQVAMGDINFDGDIDTAAGEKPAYEGDYVLWAAGPDGKFGPDIDNSANPVNTWDKGDWDNCDDITNFRQ